VHHLSTPTLGTFVHDNYVSAIPRAFSQFFFHFPPTFFPSFVPLTGVPLKAVSSQLALFWFTNVKYSSVSRGTALDSPGEQDRASVCPPLTLRGSLFFARCVVSFAPSLYFSAPACQNWETFRTSYYSVKVLFSPYRSFHLTPTPPCLFFLVASFCFIILEETTPFPLPHPLFRQSQFSAYHSPQPRLAFHRRWSRS